MRLHWWFNSTVHIHWKHSCCIIVICLNWQRQQTLLALCQWKSNSKQQPRHEYTIGAASLEQHLFWFLSFLVTIFPGGWTELYFPCSCFWEISSECLKCGWFTKNTSLQRWVQTCCLCAEFALGVTRKKTFTFIIVFNTNVCWFKWNVII